MIPKSTLGALSAPPEGAPRKKTAFEEANDPTPTAPVTVTWGPPVTPQAPPTLAELGPLMATNGGWHPGDKGMTPAEMDAFHRTQPGGQSMAGLAEKLSPEMAQRQAMETHLADLRARGNEPVAAIGNPTNGFQQQDVGAWKSALARKDPRMYNKAFGQPSAPSSQSPSSQSELVEFLKKLVGGNRGG